MSFNAFRENKILAKISEFTVSAKYTDTSSRTMQGNDNYLFMKWSLQDKPCNNVNGPLSARQRNATRMAFRWRADSDTRKKDAVTTVVSDKIYTDNYSRPMQ